MVKEIQKGDRFGQLTALKIRKMTRWNEPVWLCKCSCEQGNYVSYHENMLRGGVFERCRPCDKKYYAKCGIPYDEYINSRREDARDDSSLYKIWQSMAYRCFTSNPSVRCYFKHIPDVLCESWKKFENFYEDMFPKSKGAKLHRINSLEGFSPDNCMWKTLSLGDYSEEDDLSFDEPVQATIEDALETNSYDAPISVTMDSYLEDLERSTEQEEQELLNKITQVRKKYAHIEEARKALKQVMSI